ncbi:MAG: thioredoxin family protein [Acidobacteriota bacterium]
MWIEAQVARLKEAFSRLRDPLVVALHCAEAASPLWDRLSEVARSLEGLGQGMVRVEEVEAPELPALPALSLACGKGRGISYAAVPEGPEAAPFIRAIARLTGVEPSPTGAWTAQVSNHARPAEIIVFIAPACPFCPRTVQGALDVALTSAQVRLSIVDVERFPKLAAQYSVQSVPMTLVDRQLARVGILSSSELAELLVATTERDYVERVFLSRIETGQLDDAAADLRAGRGLDHFASLWLKSTTSTRISLMMLAEMVLEGRRMALDALVPRLLPVLSSADVPLRGDTADLLRQIAHPAAADALTALLQDPNPDVAEVAADALAAIEARRARETGSEEA